jgi:hypothetical protein
MINAGIAVLPFDGQQSFNTTTQRWVGIRVQVNYPSNQNITNNPIAVGDVVIEPNGNVWGVAARTLVSTATREYRLELSLINGTPSEEIGPDMGQVSRGAIVTPRQGFYAPHWDATLVAGEVSRIAAMLTAEQNLRENTADSNKPISTLQAAALAAKADATALANYLPLTGLDLGRFS